MEYSPIIVNFYIYKEEKIVHSGMILSMNLNTLFQTYIDFPNSPYTMKIEYTGKNFFIKGNL